MHTHRSDRSAYKYLKRTRCLFIFEKKKIFLAHFQSFAHVCNRQKVGGKLYIKTEKDFEMRFTRKCVTF